MGGCINAQFGHTTLYCSHQTLCSGRPTFAHMHLQRVFLHRATGLMGRDLLDTSCAREPSLISWVSESPYQQPSEKTELSRTISVGQSLV